MFYSIFCGRYISETTHDACRWFHDRGTGQAFWTAGQCDPSIPRVPPYSKAARFVWFISATKKTKMPYKNWEKQQPSAACDDRERCVALQSVSGYKWDDLNCRYDMCSICQI